MSLYLLIPLTAALVNAALATTIITRDPSERANRIAATLLACVGWWAFCEVLWNTQDTAEGALALVRASSLGWVWVGPLTLQLFVRISGLPARRTRRAVPVLYAISGVFLALDWFTDWLHAGVIWTEWGWAYEFGAAYPFFYVHTVSCFALGLTYGWRLFRGSISPGERAQTYWLAVGIGAPLVMASLTDGLLPMAHVQVPRVGTASFAVLGAIIAWSFHRYGYSLLAPGAFASEILETLRDGVALLRLDGHVRALNGALARMLGAPVEELLGLRLTDHLDGAPPELGRDLLDHQCELLALGGGRLPVSLSSMLLRDRQENPIGVVVVIRDLGEVVSLRNRLALSGRLAAVGELAAGIAHEINNPLAFVRANLGSLRRGWEALGAELDKGAVSPAVDALLTDGEELIDESLEGVDRAVAIIRDVRGLSHAGSEGRELADLNALLDGVLRVASPQLRGRIAVEKCYDPQLPPVPCAPQQLQQVFLNLVLNASQAIEGRGTIRVSTARDRDHAVVQVEDDGSGIPPELMERIFDPFFTTKPVGEGTGLGLGIAYEIVREHGGEILVDSEVGCGTCFRVRLRVDVDTLDAPE